MKSREVDCEGGCGKKVTIKSSYDIPMCPDCGLEAYGRGDDR